MPGEVATRVAPVHSAPTPPHLVPRMSATKPAAAPPSPPCTLRRALLSLATLAFVSFTILSARSLTPPPRSTSSARLSIPGKRPLGISYRIFRRSIGSNIGCDGGCRCGFGGIAELGVPRSGGFPAGLRGDGAEV